MVMMREQEQTPRGSRTSWHATVLVWLLVLIILLPFAQMVWTALKPWDSVDDAYYYLSQHLPAGEVREKVGREPRPLRVALVNSTVVSAACTALGVFFCSMAGYAFAKKRFPGKTALFDLVLASMAVPSAILMMPLFRLTVALHIYDTILALILPFCVTGFGIFFMRRAISTVPDSLIECARLDGLSEFAALFRVVLPSIWPSVATLAVLQFMAAWNSFVLPHAVIASPENYTVSVLLGRLMTDYRGLMWNDVMVVVIAALIPILLVFAVFSRWILRGSTAVGDESSAGT